MSYQQAKQEFGRRPVVICEIQLDKCSLAYGVAPCTASGSTQCFNTLSTCQDVPNYDPQTGLNGFVLRFSSTRVDGLQQDGQAPTFPTLMDIDTTPTKLEPGKGLGIRSSVTVSVMDFPWTDVVTDPYRGLRPGYDPDKQGSFFGRLLARHLHYSGRPMVVRTGYLDEQGRYDAANFIVRRYVLDRISGPDSNGRVTIQGKDPLKAADNDKAVWPKPTNAELQLPMSSADVNLTCVDPSGAVHFAFLAGQPYIRVDDEIMEITASSFFAGVTSLTVNRATLPSSYSGTITADTHDAEALVQICYYFDGVRIDDIVYILLNSASGIDSAFLNTPQWVDIVDAGLQNYTFSTLLIEPTGVKELLEELTQHTILLWWDEREQTVKMDSLLQRKLDGAPLQDSTSLIDGSVATTKDEKSRVSQVWLYYAHINPLLERDRPQSYNRVEVVADLDAEAPEAFGDVKIARVRSRWLPLAQRSVAGEIATRYLNNYKIRKTILSCALDPKDDHLWTGNRVQVQTRYVQDVFGDPAMKGYMILQADEKITMKGVTYEYVMAEQPDLIRTGLITPDTNPDGGGPFPDYTPATPALKGRYMFIGYDDGSGPPPNPLPFPDGSEPYKII